MPLFDTIVLTLILTVFAAFAVVLASVTRYCNNKRHHAAHRHAHHPPDMSVIIDD